MGQEYKRLKGYNVDKGSLSGVIEQKKGRDPELAYKKERKEVDILIKDLIIFLKLLDKKQQKDKEDWSVIGNIGYVKKQLKNMISFIRS